MRMDRLLCNAGYGTRKEVRQLIRSGRVRLGEEVQSDPGLNLTSEDYAALTIDQKPILLRHTVHLALYKPSGYVTAREDKWFPTVFEFIPPAYAYAEPFPVGRLIAIPPACCFLPTTGSWRIG